MKSSDEVSQPRRFLFSSVIGRYKINRTSVRLEENEEEDLSLQQFSVEKGGNEEDDLQLRAKERVRKAFSDTYKPPFRGDL